MHDDTVTPRGTPGPLTLRSLPECAPGTPATEGPALACRSLLQAPTPRRSIQRLNMVAPATRFRSPSDHLQITFRRPRRKAHENGRGVWVRAVRPRGSFPARPRRPRASRAVGRDVARTGIAPAGGVAGSGGIRRQGGPGTHFRGQPADGATRYTSCSGGCRGAATPWPCRYSPGHLHRTCRRAVQAPPRRPARARAQRLRTQGCQPCRAETTKTGDNHSCRPPRPPPRPAILIA